MEPLGRQIGKYVGHLTQLFGTKQETHPTLDQRLRAAVSARFDSLSRWFSSLSGKVEMLKNHTFSWIEETFSEGPTQDLEPIDEKNLQKFIQRLDPNKLKRVKEEVETQE